MIAIFDYGSGNVRSAERAFALTGHETVVTSDLERCLKSDGLVVPGVGAFGACMDQLIAAGGELLIQERVAGGKPLIGICVGAQILFETGTEKNGHAGVGVFAGEVSQLTAPILPHIGWNNVRADPSSRLFRGLDNEQFYFVHSFAAKHPVGDAFNSWCQYGEPFIAAVERGAVSAVQFHPEKSGAVGAKLIANWAESL